LLGFLENTLSFPKLDYLSGEQLSVLLEVSYMICSSLLLESLELCDAAEFSERLF